MASEDVLLEFQLQIFEAFKSQDPELFDVVFEVEGKRLYADKCRLSIISPTFKIMLSDQWISKNKVIKISSVTYDDFKEFLTFIYSGACSLTDGNIFGVLDIAEFYQVILLKQLCFGYVSKMKCNLDNVLPLLEISNKYSLIQLKKELKDFVSQNFANILILDGFFHVNKLIMQEIVTLKPIVKPEEIFQAVCQWAEHRADKKQNESAEANFNMNDAVKAEISDFLPYIEFKKMGLSFLREHVVTRSFLFSSDDVNELTKWTYYNPQVKITNLNGQSLYGNLSRQNTDAINVIESLKNRPSEDDQLIIWYTKCKIPSTPSSLTERDDAKWYLIYDAKGNISVVDCVKSYVSIGDYLLAEMFSESDFRFTKECKIEID